MIDCDSDRILIDAELWEEKKHNFVVPFRKFQFIREADIFLPIRREILMQSNEEKPGHIRLHGLTEEESLGKKDVYCACKYMQEKMQILRGQ